MKKLLGSLTLAAMIVAVAPGAALAQGSAHQGNVHSSGGGNAQHR